MPEKDRLGVPGIGKDLAGKLAELIETGSCRYHQELLEEFPPTILDLLHLQGVGPKTVALLYRGLEIRTLDDLERAAREGRIRGAKGMGAKKEALILKALEERQRFAGRRLMAEAHDTAAALVSELRERAPDADISTVGSLRRGCETCGDLDILAAGAPASLMDAFIGYRLVERVLARGETKSSVLLWGGFQADLRLVPRESLGACQQYFTGSKAHNIALRDRAIQRGLKLNEYGLFRVEDDVRIAGETEEGIYEALGLAMIPPELRENRGEIAAAEAGTLPRLIQWQDLRGDLHMHTTATDGRADIETMALAARETRARIHRRSPITARRSRWRTGSTRRGRSNTRAPMREIDARLEGITVLAGIECDIRPDGSMDLADDCLAQLDFVVASVHSAFNQDAAQMTDRLLRALACPWVDILGHPTGRLILKRNRIASMSTRCSPQRPGEGVALEINSQIDRLDLDDTHARLARDRGVKLVIDSDAHSPAALGNLRWGATSARRGWIQASDVLNTRPVAEFLAGLRRNRRT